MEKIIDILNNDKVCISCELFPPKQGEELPNALEIVRKISEVRPTHMSVTYGAGGSTVGYSASIAAEIQAAGIPALAHLTCVNASEKNLTEVIKKFQAHDINNIWALRGDIPAGM